MNLPEKTVKCQCGQEHVLEQTSKWCNKCGKRVFYYEKDRRKNQINNVYMYTIILITFGFLAYVFIELILEPTLKLLK